MKPLARRLARLESRTQTVAAEKSREPHILRLIDTDRSVVSQFDMGTGVWTHFGDQPVTTTATGSPE